jgi:hypothetical protein
MLRMGYLEGAALLEDEGRMKGLLEIDVMRRTKQVGLSLSVRPVLKPRACEASWCIACTG